MLKMSTGYAASIEEESTILTRRIQWKKDDPSDGVQPVVSAEQFINLQKLAENEIYIDKCILDYVSQIVRATREHPKVEIGSSPRGGLALLKVSRAMALIRGRDYVIPDDIKEISLDVLSHRIILSIEETLEGVSARSVVDEVIDSIPAPTDFSPRH
jgi:MoxR-like ATPase